MGSMWGPVLKTAPKAKPLAELLVAEAAKQGATLEDLELAAKIAAHVYERAMRSAGLSEFLGEAQAALDSI